LQVQRYILMDNAIAEALRSNPRGGDRARGQQHVNAALENVVDEAQDGDRLADTCSVYPDQRAIRPPLAWLPVSLVAAGPVFLALADTPYDIAADEGRGRDPSPPIGCQQRSRPAFAHRMPSTRL